MEIPKESKRRTVLKTIGAGVVGGTVLTGSAAAGDTDPGTNEIHLKHFNFDPKNKTVSLGSDDTVTVTWTHKENLGGTVPPHDVHLFESDSHSTHLGHSGDLFLNDQYKVKFTEDTSNHELVIDEVHDDSGNTLETGTRVDFSGGSVTLHMHCSHHDPGMSGSLTIND